MSGWDSQRVQSSSWPISKLSLSSIRRVPSITPLPPVVLGVGMHYFLLRSNQKAAALCTGLVAQMIILSTTYYQLISTEKMLFFLLLFVQSLLLLGYGLFVRSRSFVFLPVLFVALTVLTATFSLLRGLSTALIIGLTGLLLLFLGILGLLSRQKLMNATEQFGQRLSNW